MRKDREREYDEGYNAGYHHAVLEIAKALGVDLLAKRREEDHADKD